MNFDLKKISLRLRDTVEGVVLSVDFTIDNKYTFIRVFIIYDFTIRR